MIKFLTIVEGIKSIAEISNGLVSWSLSIVAASILALVGTSYLKPTNKKVRLIYLLYVPGWVCLYISIYFGNIVTRRFAACAFTSDNSRLLEFGNKINLYLIEQISLFKWGIVFFATWLFLYLIWWVFGDWEIKK